MWEGVTCESNATVPSVHDWGGRTDEQMSCYCMWQLNLDVEREQGDEYNPHIVPNSNKTYYKGQKCLLDETEIT